MSDDICGSTDTTTGNPCKRPSGWGTDSDSGFCSEHADDTRRPRKLTYELQERLATDLEEGIPVKHAAPMNGISRDTFYRWVRNGEELDEGPLSDFSDRVTRAREHGKAQILRDAMSAARNKEDAGALLRAYQEIEGGEKAHNDEATEGIPLVVPDNAQPE